jgi:hypothetical protein
MLLGHKTRTMIRHIKRYLAIRSYMLRLSRELIRRFGKQSFYSVEQVSQAVQRGKLSSAFIAYAHASFCSQKDFDTFYEPMGVACSYQGLRSVIGQRYFSGDTDFDAKTIISRFVRGNYRFSGYQESQADSDAFHGGGGGH